MSGGRRFELLQELGRGSFGTVFLAEMVSAGDFRKRVALKVLNPGVEGVADAGIRLRDEARLLGRLRHRHIVRVEGLVRLQERWAVVMEHVPGHDLADIIRAATLAEEPFPLRAAVEVCADIAAALDFAFNGSPDGGAPLRVVHRDVKPHNVRLTAAGDVVVLDFGVARAEFASREAQTGMVRMGSLTYMAPERLMDEPEGPPGDVYALGCVLYELMAGEPFGKTRLVESEQRVQVDQVLAKLEQQRPLPPLLIELLRRTLAYDPAARPTAEDLADGLAWMGREASGEDLRAYARRFVPKVAGLIPDGPRPASGTLIETRYQLPDPIPTEPVQRTPTEPWEPTDHSATWSFDPGALPDDAPTESPEAPLATEETEAEILAQPSPSAERDAPAMRGAVRPILGIGLLVVGALAVGWFGSRVVSGRSTASPEGAAAMVPPESRSTAAGIWTGDVGGAGAELALDGSDAALVGGLTLTDGGALPVSGLFEPGGGTLVLQVPADGGRLVLSMAEDGASMRGDYTAGGDGHARPVELRRDPARR